MKSEKKKMDRKNNLRTNDIIFWQCNLFDFSWLTCQGGPASPDSARLMAEHKNDARVLGTSC